jgi:N-acetylmuramic acid 6-phosphate etherase
MQLDEYLKVYPHFQLGNIQTEGFHPLTQNLSTLAQEDIDEAYDVLKEVDMRSLGALLREENKIYKLHLRVWSVLNAGNKVFLSGCGATGRLSIALECLFRQTFPAEFQDQIISFMAGGDVALISSIEKFEDRHDFGVKQLMELGFSDADLLIAATEGGETTFVIGTAEQAAKVSCEKPFFLYCNPDKELENIKRCSQVFNNERIEKINLTCGEMALSGSTRMQASTILMGAIGFALLNQELTPSHLNKLIIGLMSKVQDFDYSLFKEFTFKEATLYSNNQKVLYETTSNLAVSILTDTTERSPTFSLRSFENYQEENHSETSLCYLKIAGAKDAKDAWSKLLGREPRVLDWEEIEGVANLDKLLGFDISENIEVLRSKKAYQYLFEIKQEGDQLFFELDGTAYGHDVRGFSLLEIHLLLKLILNAHSTLLMGRLNRFEQNMMTWVRPSNLKLIDRSLRYIKRLLESKQILVEYEDLAKKLFEIREGLNENESIVMKTIEYYTTLF